MSSSGRFTTLERSLNTLGVNVVVTGASSSGSKKKGNKKRSKKAKAVVIATSEDSAAVAAVEMNDEGWIAVTSKRSKSNSSPRDDEADIPSAVATTPTPSSCQLVHLPECNKSASKKKRRRPDKTKVSESSFKASEAGPIPSPTPQALVPNDLLQDALQLSEPALPQCSPPTTQGSHEKADALLHAYESESIVSEVLGKEAVIKARTAFPTLTFSQPPPVTTAPSDLKRAIPLSDFIQMKAHLCAKEAECQVLREEVVRLSTQVKSEPQVSPSTSTEASQKVSSEKPKQQQMRRLLPMASKEVQCEIQASTPPEVEPSAQPSPSSNSTEAKVILSLQVEIARLAQENTLLTQRQTNLEGRLENSKRQNSKLQSEMRKAASVASKEAEAAVRQQMGEVVKKLQVEVTDKEELLSTKTAQLELAEQTKDEALQNLHDLQKEHSELMEAKRTEELHLADTMKMLENMQKERDDAKREQTASTHNLNVVRSSMEAEVNGLRQQLVETEAHLKASLDQSTRLKEELASAQSELATTKKVMAEVTEKNDCAVSDETEAQLKAALDQCALLKEELASTQAELAAAKVAMTELTEKHVHEVSTLKAHTEELVAKTEESLKCPAPAEMKSSTPEEVCGECAHLSAEVVRYQEIIALTEDALSHLQRSVGKEEERWRLALRNCCDENTQLKARLCQLASQSEGDEAVIGNKKSLDSTIVFPKVIENGANSSNGRDFSPSIVENGGLDQDVNT
ncbi:microtubule associated protein [Echinococcus multilocularis]|uniref:Microtubule associated protein n=1 Tax=Echinococcus multilocularis TaxID=6211 RepID=A0A068XX55_ECHMU|nr:microtubule associated protein [Echinococcus multilocularis]